ncbi:MAG: hypothetical protein AB1468_01350 [Candidatus Micrarchaeota archaeon]
MQTLVILQKRRNRIEKLEKALTELRNVNTWHFSIRSYDAHEREIKRLESELEKAKNLLEAPDEIRKNVGKVHPNGDEITYEGIPKIPNKLGPRETRHGKNCYLTKSPGAYPLPLVEIHRKTTKTEKEAEWLPEGYSGGF